MVEMGGGTGNDADLNSFYDPREMLEKQFPGCQLIMNPDIPMETERKKIRHESISELFQE